MPIFVSPIPLAPVLAGAGRVPVVPISTLAIERKRSSLAGVSTPDGYDLLAWLGDPVGRDRRPRSSPGYRPN